MALPLAPSRGGRCFTTFSGPSSGFRSATPLSVGRQRPPHRDPAGRILVRADVHQGRIIVEAAVDLKLAARVEATAARWADEVRGEAFDGQQAIVPVRVQAWDRLQ